MINQDVHVHKYPSEAKLKQHWRTHIYIQQTTLRATSWHINIANASKIHVKKYFSIQH